MMMIIINFYLLTCVITLMVNPLTPSIKKENSAVISDILRAIKWKLAVNRVEPCDKYKVNIREYIIVRVCV